MVGDDDGGTLGVSASGVVEAVLIGRTEAARADGRRGDLLPKLGEFAS